MSRTLSQDSGFESLNSQKSTEGDSGPSAPRDDDRGLFSVRDREPRKRRLSDRSGCESDTEISPKRSKPDMVQPLVKAASEPVDIDKKMAAKETDSNLCIVCCVEPKSGVFAHGKIAHICCCYKCAVKVWNKAKRCPICNCKVSNVLRAVVM